MRSASVVQWPIVESEQIHTFFCLCARILKVIISVNAACLCADNNNALSAINLCAREENVFTKKQKKTETINDSPTK